MSYVVNLSVVVSASLLANQKAVFPKLTNHRPGQLCGECMGQVSNREERGSKCPRMLLVIVVKLSGLIGCYWLYSVISLSF